MRMTIHSSRANEVPGPAIDFAALLDTRFYRDRGTFSLGAIPLLFPTPGLLGSALDGGWRIRTASGSIVARHTITHASETAAAAIVVLQTQSGVTGDGHDPLESGRSYTLDIDLEGVTVGSLPFTVSMAESGDPYRPSTAWVLDGPWRTHAHFEHAIEGEDQYVNFNAWVGPDDGRNGEKVEAVVLRGGEEVAWGRGGSISSAHGWVHRRFELYPTEFRDYPDGRPFDERYRHRWRLREVSAGPYEIVLSTESGPFRTFSIEATDGGFVPHPRSALDYEPRTRYLTSRQMLDASMRTDQRLDNPQMLYWIGPVE